MSAGLPTGDVDEVDVDRGRLIAFRQRLYGCLGRWADALFELIDAVLAGSGRMISLVELSLE